MIDARYKLSWLHPLLKDLQLSHLKNQTLLYCNNKTTLHIALNPLFHERTKLIKIDCHVIHDKIQDGSVITKHITLAE